MEKINRSSTIDTIPRETGLETDHVRPFNVYLSRDALLVVREGAKIGLAEKRFTFVKWTFYRHTRRPWGPRYPDWVDTTRMGKGRNVLPKHK